MLLKQLIGASPDSPCEAAQGVRLAPLPKNSRQQRPPGHLVHPTTGSILLLSAATSKKGLTRCPF